MEKWQPIEAAPKDGTEVLTWTPGLQDGGARMVMRYDHNNGWHDFWGNCDLQPSDWIPLREPPEKEAGK